MASPGQAPRLMSELWLHHSPAKRHDSCQCENSGSQEPAGSPARPTSPKPRAQEAEVRATALVERTYTVWVHWVCTTNPRWTQPDSGRGNPTPRGFTEAPAPGSWEWWGALPTPASYCPTSPLGLQAHFQRTRPPRGVKPPTGPSLRFLGDCSMPGKITAPQLPPQLTPTPTLASLGSESRGKGGSERLSDMPRVTKLVASEPQLETSHPDCKTHILLTLCLWTRSVSACVWGGRQAGVATGWL